jgi:hypothetical protein
MYSANHLNRELQRLGINFIAGSSQPEIFTPLTPAELLAGLATQRDARMRSAIIAALLQRPELATDVDRALENLEAPFRKILQLYYTAAYYLQLFYFDDLEHVLGSFQTLPDRYSIELNLFGEDEPSTDPLKLLASRHQKIADLPINWYGTYHHVAQRVITRLTKEKEWAKV